MSGNQLSKTRALASLALFLTTAVLLSFLVVSSNFWENLVGSEPQTPPTSTQYAQEELVDYALSLINSDRQSSNVSEVTLSSVRSAQQHAEDMLKNGYFSHWDTNGYKPYVRYTLAGGRGAVNENIAVHSASSLDPKTAITDLEWSMMNDDAESNWGHKANILDAFHNKVSIGIAYNSNSLYMVQDFENEYVHWANLNVSNGTAFLAGTLTSSLLRIGQVDIYFDGLVNLTAVDLSNFPYNGIYDSGLFVGSVAVSRLILSEGIFVVPQTWDESGQAFQIKFSLSQFFSQFGEGIYTLCLWSTDGKCLTSHSIFLSH